MPSAAHEVLIQALREDPSLLAALVDALTGRTLPAGLTPVDSTIRFVKTAEVRPDLLLSQHPLSQHNRLWAIVEIQNAIDAAKGRRWLLAAGVLLDQTGILGDVIIITAHHHVAQWAHAVAHLESKAGTRLSLTPLVLFLGEKEVERLLDEHKPELAFFAAWAMHGRHGPEAQKVLVQAVDLTRRLPVALQKAQMDAILSVLSRRMLALLTERSMDRDKIPMSPEARRLSDWYHAHVDAAFAKGEAKGELEGERKGKLEGKLDALLSVLGARGLSMTADQRAVIRGCTDLATLDTWIAAAVSAPTVADVLASRKPARAAKRSPAAKAPARKAAPRKKATARRGG